MKAKLRRSEATAQETSPLLLQLQAEMTQLKQQHTVAIQQVQLSLLIKQRKMYEIYFFVCMYCKIWCHAFQEQHRAKDAEDRARYLAAANEERVANLESHLAELSETVGTYDRMRQQDQLAIQKLKVSYYWKLCPLFLNAECNACNPAQDHIAQLNTATLEVAEKPEKDESAVEKDSAVSVQTILEDLSRLKEQLVESNRLSEKPIDVEGEIK